LKFSNIRYSNLAPFIAYQTKAPPGFDALLEGEASVNGPILNTDELAARLQVDRLDVKTSPRGSPTGGPPQQSVDFQNDGPLVVTLGSSIVRVAQFRIRGPRTNLTVSGAIKLKDSESPLGLNLKADADLGVLQDVSRQFYSSGSVALNATVRGTFAQPLVNGSVELKNANINYADAPNGLSNGSGTILLNGNTATIQNLTGESGGGKITVGGFVGFSTSVLSYNIRASAAKVRTRYSGVSITSNANLSLVGNSRRSLLGGTVTIQRIAYSSSSDAGSILSTASTPPSTPTAPSPLLANMRLAIRIVTAPDLRVVTTYADRLDVAANLTVRGTAASPGILGRVNVTNGQLVFFGNTYEVNKGTVNFYDPNAIQPVLNVSLETIAQGVDVLIDVSGPMNDLKLSYRSDPPLTFEQIVQLLATNTTPSDPTIAAHQPVPPQQSLSQMGESALLGQAIANPLASRVQRVFGLTQFKIDPSFSGSNGQPSARVTLQQKVASNITFTYITDVTQTNSEIVRVQWDLTPKFSAVALRDFNGNVSVEFFYKFKVR
jgi:translocation and assembly module TamB